MINLNAEMVYVGQGYTGETVIELAQGLVMSLMVSKHIATRKGVVLTAMSMGG